MTKQIVEKIINECTKDDYAFTIYDIIPEARSRGCKLDKHQIENIIKKSYYPIYYKCSPIMINDISVDVYHPADISATSYDHSDITFDINKTHKYKKITKDIDNIQYDKKCIIGKNGKYYLTKYKVEEAGFKKGDKLFCVILDKCIELKSINSVLTIDKKPARLLTVMSRNQIQIRSGAIKQAFNGIPKSVNILSNKGIIKIFSNN